MPITSLPPANPYVTHGTSSEQNLVQGLITEAIAMCGITMMYMPRTMVALDSILGEDRQSKFVNAVPIEFYFKDITGFSGNNEFLNKFGLMLDQSATFTVSRQRWATAISENGTMLPARPNEGDLIWYPQTDSLFEIKNVIWQNPFYQLNQLYVYDLSVQLFTYASEHIQTGVAGIDAFETLNSFDTTISPSASGNIELNAQNSAIDSAAIGTVFTPTNPFGGL
jgi:hypothetical protein